MRDLFTSCGYTVEGPLKGDLGSRLVARATGHRVEARARELVDLVREDLAALESGRSPEG